MTGRASTLLGGRYRLGEPIGRGGMGAVWRARDTVLDRDVAIKILVLQVDDNPDASARFRREARLLARLSHPRLGGVHDYGEEEGRAFMVMDFLTGETLQHRLGRVGRMPAADAAEIAAQVAEGLHAAHQAGVIHRDVKPANVILAEQGVKLVDFGIALGAGDDPLTATGTLVGSATYLAPERGAGRPATPASDVYSLAVVLYQMLAGKPPFTSTDPVWVVSAHAQETAPPLPGDIPAGLAQCCRGAMEKNPALRPASALAFAAMLREGSARTELFARNGTGIQGTLFAASTATSTAGARGHQRRGFDGAREQGGPGTGTRVGSADGSWPPTQALPLAETPAVTPQPSRPRLRRWSLPAAATVAAIIAGTGIVMAVAAAPGSGHAARLHETAAAHDKGGRPPAQPPSLPPNSLPATPWVIAAGTQQNPGQVQPPPPVLAPPGATVRVTEILVNNAKESVTSATLNLSAPQGWTVTPESSPAVASVPAGGKAAVTWRVTAPAGAQPGGFNLVAAATCSAAAQCAAAPVTGSAVVPYASFSQAFNNAGIAPQAEAAAANLDGTGLSYQTEALAAAGYLPGGQVAHDGILFEWPNAPAGKPDNVAAQGQTFLIAATGPHLAFLGAADFGSTGGNGTVFYQNGAQQSFHLAMDDWWANQATPGQDELAVTTAHPNGPPDQPPLTGPPVAVYFASIPLRQGAAVEAVTLPAGSAPANGVPCLHLFAIAVG